MNYDDTARGESQFGGEDSARLVDFTAGNLTRFNDGDLSIDPDRPDDHLSIEPVDLSYFNNASSIDQQPSYYPYGQALFHHTPEITVPTNSAYAAYYQYPVPPVIQNNRSVSSYCWDENHGVQSPYQYHSPPDPSRPVILHQPYRPNRNHVDQPVALPLRLPSQTSHRYGQDVIARAGGESADGDSSQSVDHPRKGRSEDSMDQKDTPVLESAGAASRRKHRERSAPLLAALTPTVLNQTESASLSPALQPSPQSASQEFTILLNGAPDPAKRGKKPPTTKQKQIQEQMIELGGACILCSEKRKICNLSNTCGPCHAAGIRCIRHKGEFWLFKAPVIESQVKGSLNKAFEKAKTDTLKDVFSILRDLSGTSQVPATQVTLDRKNIIILQVGAKPSALAASQSLEIRYSDLRQPSHASRDTFSSKLVQAVRKFVPLSSLPLFDRMKGKAAFEETKLLGLITSALGDLSLIQCLRNSKIHCAVGEQPVATALGGLICASLVKHLGNTADKLCDDLRERVRHKKGHYAETLYAIAVYYLIVKALMDLDTSSAIDDILNPLRTQLPAVCSTLQSLFEKTQETLKNEKKTKVLEWKPQNKADKARAEKSVSPLFQGMLDPEQDLETFVSSYVPDIPCSPSLHFAFYIAHEDGLPMSSRAARQLNPFDHRSPLLFGDLLQRNPIDPGPLFTAPSNVSPVLATSYDSSRRSELPKIGTSFAPGPSTMPSLTRRNLDNLTAISKTDSRLLSPSTARHAHHASLRTSQAGTAVSPLVESEITVAVSPQTIEDLDSHEPVPMTEGEKQFDFESLQMTQEKPTDRSELKFGKKRAHSPDSDVSPSSVTFPSKRRADNDTLDLEEFHEGAFRSHWDESFGKGDASTEDAIRNRSILSSSLFSSHLAQ